MLSSGGSRNSRRDRGLVVGGGYRGPRGGGGEVWTPEVCQNERIWTLRGVCEPGTPSRSANVVLHITILQDLYSQIDGIYGKIYKIENLCCAFPSFCDVIQQVTIPLFCNFHY